MWEAKQAVKLEWDWLGHVGQMWPEKWANVVMGMESDDGFGRENVDGTILMGLRRSSGKSLKTFAQQCGTIG